SVTISCYFPFSTTCTLVSPLSLHDALPICNFPLGIAVALVLLAELVLGVGAYRAGALQLGTPDGAGAPLLGRSNIDSIGALLYRSEEHTSELQSRENLVCRLLLEKKEKVRE